MFAIYDKTARVFYRGTYLTPGRHAIRYTARGQAVAALDTIQTLGEWPLYNWAVAKLRAQAR